MFLYGKNPVHERLKANPSSIKRVFLQENFNGPDIAGLIKANNIPVRQVSEKELSRIKKADRLQGVVAEIERFEYADIYDLVRSDDKPTLIFLDNINDPHNLGSIIRIAACFGNFGIVIPSHNCCEVTESVLHVASGGENFIPVAKVSNLINVLIEAKKQGYWIAGAVVKGGKNLGKEKLLFPLCLVMGSEGEGIRQGVEKHLDMKITIPMKGAGLSFNVAMATAIFCYEISKQDSH